VQVAAIEAKYGAPLATSHPEDLKAVYGTFVEAVIPPGDAPLTGREPQLIQAFKAALALPDVDAAPAHIEVGRRILRGRLEAGSRGEDVEVGATAQPLRHLLASLLISGCGRQSSLCRCVCCARGLGWIGWVRAVALRAECGRWAPDSSS
jgi:hypothetical protein